MRVLVVNAGSSSLKLSLLDVGERIVAERELPARESEVDVGELRAALDGELSGADAVGHRIVHGGERFKAAVLIDREVRAALAELAGLAPLHQRKSLAALDAVSEALPGLPAVACFDTAFHATLAPGAATYAIPAPWRERFGIRRYGFHGLSHAWIARRAPMLLRSADGLRLVSCHLGAGASLCAIRDGRSIDTTMGFTPLEGLVMATRSGSFDPGAVLWLLEHGGLSTERLAHALEHESGLLALAGTDDMREVLAREAQGDAGSRLALEVYVHRLRAGIAAMAAALDGVDAVAFTGGVGERSAEIRRRVVAGLSFLGLRLDDGHNERVAGEGDVSAAGAPARVLVVTAREDLEIAAQTRALLSLGTGSAAGAQEGR